MAHISKNKIFLKDGAYRLNSIFQGDLIGYYYNGHLIAIKNNPSWCYIKNNCILTSKQGNILFYSTKEIASKMNFSEYSININDIYVQEFPMQILQ